MGWFALNVREDQLSQDRQALRVSQLNLTRALTVLGEQIVLYAPRGEMHEGYFGLAQITRVDPDLSSSNFVWLQLAGVTLFEKPVPLEDLYGSGQINDTPFHTYSRAIRSISNYEAERLQLLERLPLLIAREGQDVGAYEASVLLSTRLSKQRIRSARLRIRMLEHYGPECAFTGLYYPSLDGRHFSTQVGHLQPLKYGGPDIIQNVLPMAPEVNWHWDNGIISLTNAGKLLVSANASAQSRRLFRPGKIVRFIDPQLWPRAEFLQWHRDNLFEMDRQTDL